MKIYACYMRVCSRHNILVFLSYSLQKCDINMKIFLSQIPFGDIYEREKDTCIASP